MDADFILTDNFIVRSYRLMGDDDQAFEWFIRSLTQDRENAEQLQSWKTLYANSGWRGIFERQLEKQREKEKTADFNPMQSARLYIELGNREEAFANTEKAFVQHSWAMTTLKVEPQFDSLRSDPRFDDLVRRVGLK